jgi:hypothetical protein
MTTTIQLFDEREAARQLGLSVATMRRRRLFRQPPAWLKLGSRVLYRAAELEAFVEASVVQLGNAGSNNRRHANAKRRPGDG